MTDETQEPDTGQDTQEHTLAELEAAGQADELTDQERFEAEQTDGDGADPDVDHVTPDSDPYYQPGDENATEGVVDDG